jgi:hypothetical protein
VLQQLESFEHEHVLEIGFVLTAVAFVAGFGILVGGRLAAAVGQRARHAESAPEVGVVPPERHQQFGTSAR